MTSQLSQCGTGICAAATSRHSQSARCSSRPGAQLTNLGDETLLNDEVSNVERAVTAEAEALQAVSGGVEELMFFQELPEVLQDFREGRRGVHLLLQHMQAWCQKSSRPTISVCWGT